MSQPRILVFDSGIGGLSIAACIRQALPGVRLMYLADSARFPYGAQTEAVVIERSKALIAEALSAFPCDVVVVACNTASTVVLPELRSMTDTPVIGVVPAIKPAASLSRNRRIGLLATPATIKRPYLTDLVESFASDCSIERIGHPELVRWVEGQLAGEQLPEQALSRALQPFRDAGVDTVVLGCTHYPLIKPLLQKLLPEVIHWVDSGEAIARRVEWLLEQAGAEGSALKRPLPGRPMEGALFTGALPEGVDGFLASLNLSADQCLGHWPAKGGVRSAESA
ncbi:glutamate racemase [Marinobacter sp. CHS3-4]|uniref:glutamate racemase n=1 Tax=Marinobacter sp. CHS3-4 TaxID=3045174 RepID=UPI0024B618B5|nr:glutamate racemase [Marinobacter sp. CHS3-4]MDI9246099.1 glutamate racemase [Marinobacter sp. CHS3-4]